jgi:hypothetical protein
LDEVYLITEDNVHGTKTTDSNVNLYSKSADLNVNLYSEFTNLNVKYT